MSVDVVIASFLHVANEDLAAAKLLAAAGNRNAAYQCEQAAEKIIKAVLTSEGVHSGIKHDLVDLVGQVPNENPVKPLLVAVEHLGAFATAFRYPSPAGRIKPPPSNIHDLIADVDRALQEVARRFGVDLVAKTPASTPSPIR